MSKAIPQVSKYMTTTPVTAKPTTTLGQARRLMKDNNIRHLPVVDDNALVGLVTQSDLRVVEGLVGTQPGQVKLEEIMQQAPFTCAPDAALDDVVDQMVAHKWGSTVVMQNREVVGIFTSIDAMRALVELTRTRLGK